MRFPVAFVSPLQVAEDLIAALVGPDASPQHGGAVVGKTDDARPKADGGPVFSAEYHRAVQVEDRGLVSGSELEGPLETGRRPAALEAPDFTLRLHRPATDRRIECRLRPTGVLRSTRSIAESGTSNRAKTTSVEPLDGARRTSLRVPECDRALMLVALRPTSNSQRQRLDTSNLRGGQFALRVAGWVSPLECVIDLLRKHEVVGTSSQGGFGTGRLARSGFLAAAAATSAATVNCHSGVAYGSHNSLDSMR